jgi:flagellin
MKLSASIRRTEATQANVNNALSFLQTQDGVLKSADKVITRLSELAQLSADVTKSDADKALYQTEFSSLTSALSSMTEELFNDIGLFDTTTQTSLTVVTSQEGGQSVAITVADLDSIVTGLSGVNLTTGAVTTNIDAVETAIQSLATMRAKNGSEQVRLTFAAAFY